MSEELEAELVVLHNTCGAYERELAHHKSALSAIRALIQQWREKAEEAAQLVARYEQQEDHAGNAHAFRKERRIWTTCADQLEALCPTVK